MICISTCRATMEIVERSWSEQRLKSLRGLTTIKIVGIGVSRAATLIATRLTTIKIVGIGVSRAAVAIAINIYMHSLIFHMGVVWGRATIEIVEGTRALQRLKSLGDRATIEIVEGVFIYFPYYND